MKTRTKLLSCSLYYRTSTIVLLIFAITASFGEFGAANTNAAELPDAVSYLKAQDDSAWVTMALVAAGLPGQGEVDLARQLTFGGSRNMGDDAFHFCLGSERRLNAPRLRHFTGEEEHIART